MTQSLRDDNGWTIRTLIVRTHSYLCHAAVNNHSSLEQTKQSSLATAMKKRQASSFVGGEEGEFMTRVGKSKRPIKFAEGLETKARMQNNTKFLISTPRKAGNHRR